MSSAEGVFDAATAKMREVLFSPQQAPREALGRHDRSTALRVSVPPGDNLVESVATAAREARENIDGLVPNEQYLILSCHFDDKERCIIVHYVVNFKDPAKMLDRYLELAHLAAESHSNAVQYTRYKKRLDLTHAENEPFALALEDMTSIMRKLNKAHRTSKRAALILKNSTPK